MTDNEAIKARQDVSSSRYDEKQYGVIVTDLKLRTCAGLMKMMKEPLAWWEC